MTTVRVLRADTGEVLVEQPDALAGDAMPVAIRAAALAPGVDLILELDNGLFVDRTLMEAP